MQPLHKHIAIGALAMGLIVGADNSPAADLTWTNGNGYWQSTTAWAPAGSFPGAADGAYFTNAATYSVRLSNDVSIQRNSFSNAPNTTASVTLDLGTYQLSPTTGDPNGAFVVGDGATSTTIVYLASSTIPGKGLFVPHWIVVGNNGIGTLVVTNGSVTAGQTILGFGDGSRGTLVLSGPNTVWTNSDKIFVGNSTNSFGSSLVISNSASMILNGGFRMGDSTSNNTVLLDTGGKLVTVLSYSHIGQYKGDPSVPSYNNTVIVQGGAAWDFEDHSLHIGSCGGGVATGNVLTVGVGGFVTNISVLEITASNRLNMAGGLYGGKNGDIGMTVGSITCAGTVQGFGTVIADTTINSGGFFSPFNSLGALVFSNSLTLASNSTTTVQLGTNFHTTVVSSNLTLDGTLSVTDSGGFANGTNTLFSYSGTLTTNGTPTIMTIGTTPDVSKTYTINIATAGQVKLIVSGGAVAPVGSFTGSPTNGAAPLTVTFTNTSTGNITNGLWNFGDGGTSNTTVTSLAHTYNTSGVYTVGLTVSGLGGSNTLTRGNYITVLEPAHLVVNPGSLNFGSATIGLTNWSSFSLINTGGISMGGGVTCLAPFIVTNNPSIYSMNAGQTTTLAVAFAPSSAGIFNGSAIFNSSGGNSTNALTGVGLTPGSITVAPAVLDFGTLVTGAAAQASLTVTNSGGTAVSNGTATVTGGPFAILSGATFSVPGFGATNVTVQFAPVSAGAFTDSVVFASSNGGNTTNAVIGTGCGHPSSFIWTNGSGYWQSTTAWTPAGGFPGVPGTLGTNDSAFFTNAATYSVTLSNDVSVQSNYFSNASGTAATVTLDLGANTLNAASTNTTPGAFVVGDGAGSTTIVYLASSTNSGKGLLVAGNAVVGNNGAGTMFATNGNVSANTTILGNNAGTGGTLVLSGSRSVWTNSSSLYVGNNGSGNLLVVTNGGTIVNGAGYVGFNTNSSGNNVLVGGSGSVWSNRSSLYVGNNGSGNSLVISNGGRVFSPSGYIGNAVVSTNNSVLVTGSGSVWTNSSFLYIGNSGNSNSLVINNGGTVFNTLGYIGRYGANNNVLVGGSGSVWSNRSSLYVGHSGSGNSLVITNGGTVFSPSSYIGYAIGSTSNSVLVTGSGSVWTNSSYLDVGYQGGGHSLVINHGGTVFDNIGYIGVYGSNNSVLVTDSGSVWSNQTGLLVGYSGSSNSLAINNGATVVSSNLYLGYNTGSANNFVTLNGGNLTVTNAGNGVLDVRCGTLTMNSSDTSVGVDQLVVTNGASSVVTFNGGALITRSTTVSNGTAFTAGNGSSSATLILANGGTGIHGFNDGLVISSNATLNGVGAVLGATTVNPGGTLAPGNGTLIFSNNLVLNSAAVLQYELGTNSDLTVVSGNLALDGTLNVTDAGGFTNGTYTLFTYGGVLTTNGSASILTIGTTPSPALAYTVDISSNGCVKLIVAPATPPAASFTATPTNGWRPLAVAFSDTSTGTITNRFWDFGDGNTANATVTHPSHTYAAAGTYTVALTTSGPLGSDTQTRPNYIVAASPPPLVAGFNGSPTNGVAPLAVTFSDSSSGAITNRFWDFGDGNTTNTTATSLSHAYSAAGSYTVSLTVSGYGGSDTSTEPNYILVIPPPPVAGFNGSPTNGAAPLAVTFTDTSSGAITNRFWDFGDGNTTNTAATSLSHMYSAAGTSTVSLTVSGLGGEGNQTRTNYIVVGVPPVAGFSANPTNGLALLIVTFTNVSTGEITNRFWDFGDGGTTSTVNPTHTYTNAGMYSVSLTDYGPYGTNTKTLTNLITVSAASATWTNANASGNWSGSPSWNPVAVPDYGSSVIFGTAGTTSVVDNISRTVSNITFSRSADFSVVASGGASLTINDGITATTNFTYTIAAPIVLGGTNVWSVGNGGTLQVSGPISGTNSISKTGPGTLVLATNNTYSGGTTISGGAIELGGPTGAVNVAGLGSGSVTFSNNSTLRFWGYDGATRPNHGFNTNDLVVPAGQTATICLPPIFLDDNNATNGPGLGGSLTGGGTLNLVVWNWLPNISGVWSNFTGQINVVPSPTQPGQTYDFRLGNFGFPHAALYLTNGDRMCNIFGNGRTIDIGELSGESGATVGLGNGNSINPTWRVGAKNTTATFAGTITDAGVTTVIKVGSGTWILTGTNTYSGGTTVSNGTLLVNNASGTGTGAVTVASGATLGGGGTIRGPVTISSGGTLAPGNGVGTLTISNNLVVNNAAVLEYDLGTNGDRTVVSGNLTLGGTLNITDAGGFTTNTYTLFTYGGTLTNNGVTIGTAPVGYIYVIDTNTAGQVRLVAGYQPVAAFNGNPTNGTAPLTVSFTDTSSGTITNRFWDFGDGNTTNTTATGLTYTYSVAGTNTVNLTVSGPVGASTLALTNYIVVINPAHLVVNPGSLSYGAVTVGQANNLNFYVINTGDVSLNGTATSAVPFAVTTGSAYTVAGGQTSTVTVAFAPGSAAAFNDSVIFASNGGESTNTVSGMGLTAGSIAVTPSTLDFGTLATGTTAQASFVVTNSGGTAVSNGTATANGGPFTIISGAAFSVGGFGSTNVTVQFAPVSAGAFTNSVVFATANGGDATNTASGTGAIVPVASFSATPTNGWWPLAVAFTDISTGTITNRHWDFGDGNTTNTTATSFSHTYAAAGSNTVSLTASGPVGSSTLTLTNYIVVVNPAHLLVNPGSLTYGSVTIGHTNSLSFSVINTGDTSLSGTATSAAPFGVTSGAVYNVAGGQTNTVTVAFAPGSAATFNDSVIFTSNGGVSTNTVSGTGLTPGSIAATPSGIDFGTLATGTTASASFVVTNSGGTAVSNGTATVSGPFTIVSGATFSVSGFGTTNVAVQFAPVSAGMFTDSVFFASANGGDATNTVAGTGAIVPVASFNASPTNGPWLLTVTFTDSSSGTITNRHWDFGDGNTTNTTAISFSHTYAAAGSNTVGLTASGPVGSSTLTLANYIVVVNPAHLLVNPGSLSYGAVTVGQTNSLSFSVINTGDTSLSGTATSTVPFAVTSGGLYTVAGGQTQTVSAAFGPNSAGTFNSTVIFTSNGGVSTNTVSGIGLTPGSVSVTPSTLDFGTLATGTTAQASFVVTNSGGTTVSNGTATASGGPFTVVAGATFSVGGFGSTNVTVQFAPVSAGAFTDNVIFATANGGKATNTVSGTGAIVPVAAFSGTPTNGVTPLAVTFTDSSSGTLTNRHWSFGDGATSNTLAASVVHTYNVAGSNTVQLIASGPVGVSTNTRVNYIIVTVHCDYTLSATNASFGVTGGSNTVTVVASTNLCPWTASSNNSWIQIAGGSVSATGSAVVAYTVLSNEGSSSARAGTMTIAGQTFTVTQTGDTTAPTVILTAPTSGIVSNTIAVSATATDDVAVVKVEFYRDGSVLLGTVTTAPYNVNFDTTSLGDGSHCFYAKAYDAANNVSGSATNCVTVDNTAPSVPAGLTATAVSTNQIHLSWSASSDGTGSGVAGYEVFRDGTQIATTATTDYSDAGLALGNEYCYQVAAYDGAGHTSTSSAAACAQTFVTPGSLLGTYNGLAIQTNAPSHASSGSLTLVLGKTGSFAANLAMGGVKSAFKGQFDDAGNATGTVTRKGLSSLQAILHLDVASGTDQITGTVSDGVFTSELLADRAVYSRTKPSPWVGSYTVVLVPPDGDDPNIPLGYGYGTLIVTTTGRGKLSGFLGDGTKITGSVPVSKHGTWPLYDALYNNGGSCIGWVTFVASNHTLEATVAWFRPPLLTPSYDPVRFTTKAVSAEWFKLSLPTSACYPAGFATNVALIGAEYVSASAGGPSPAGNREITLGGGNLASSIVKTVAVDTVGNASVWPPNSESLKITLQPATGQWSGSFTHPALNKTISFKALTLQSEGSSAGYFLGTNQSGYVILEPVP